MSVSTPNFSPLTLARFELLTQVAKIIEISERYFSCYPIFVHA